MNALQDPPVPEICELLILSMPTLIPFLASLVQRLRHFDGTDSSCGDQIEAELAGLSWTFV